MSKMVVKKPMLFLVITFHYTKFKIIATITSLIWAQALRPYCSVLDFNIIPLTKIHPTAPNIIRGFFSGGQAYFTHPTIYDGGMPAHPTI